MLDIGEKTIEIMPQGYFTIFQIKSPLWNDLQGTINNYQTIATLFDQHFLTPNNVRVIVDSGYCSFQKLLYLRKFEDQDVSLYMLSALTGTFDTEWLINSSFWLPNVEDNIGTMASIKLCFPSHISLKTLYDKN